MFRRWLKVRARGTGTVTMARPAVLAIVLAIVLATAWTATAQRAYVTQADDGAVPASDTLTTTGLTKPSSAAATDPDSTGSTGLTFTVVPVSHPSLTIAKTHAGTFTRGGDGVYTITVGNTASAGPTNGTTVTVHDTLPAGLRADSITGTGWNCTPATLTCTRSDVLPAGHRYPPVTLKVDVSCDTPARVTNTATVTGGADPTTHTATDTTKIESNGYDGAGYDGGGYDGAGYDGGGYDGAGYDGRPGHCDRHAH
ncbi:hypothetical protein ACGFYV_36715 [Streptomyces sp. NPDC048297]|uniref:hypothetical protein n=1 Tax=Streptomyces sp. NPDC048297 TaxID=3365531 RepID=UPI003716959D